MESLTRPQLVDSYIIRGVHKYDINIDIVQKGEMFYWEQVRMQDGKWDYSGIVDALVQHKYPIDKMQAWRKEAKEIAKEALLYELS